MGLAKTQEPHIDPADPWANDDLHRQNEGELLVRLIQSLAGSYVIAVKGKWGSGKSVFLRRLGAALERTAPRTPVIAIDAWRTDHLDDPLIAFVAATEQRISAESTNSKEVVDKGKKILKALAGHIGTLSSSITSMVAEANAPGTGAVAGAATTAITDAGAELLRAVKAQKDAEAQFREQLAKARDYLTKREYGRPHLAMVVTIDELDRCRPDYAIKVLERIKHFFDVPGVIFVIATDGKNLPNAVASVYGEKVDGELYLRKFFDYEFELSEPDPQSFVQVLANQFDFDRLIASSPHGRSDLLSRIQQPNQKNYAQPVVAYDRGLDALEIIQAFPLIAQKMSLSLRDQAQAFTLISAYLRTLRSTALVYPVVATFILCLRFGRADLYQALRAGECDLLQIFEPKNGNALLSVDDWISSTSTGLDLIFFATATRQEAPRQYIENMLYSVSNEKPFRPDRVAAAERLHRRIAIENGSIGQYIPRALRLADAFG